MDFYPEGGYPRRSSAGRTNGWDLLVWLGVALFFLTFCCCGVAVIM